MMQDVERRGPGSVCGQHGMRGGWREHDNVLSGSEDGDERGALRGQLEPPGQDVPLGVASRRPCDAAQIRPDATIVHAAWASLGLVRQ